MTISKRLDKLEKNIKESKKVIVVTCREDNICIVEMDGETVLVGSFEKVDEFLQNFNEGEYKLDLSKLSLEQLREWIGEEENAISPQWLQVVE